MANVIPIISSACQIAFFTMIWNPIFRFHAMIPALVFGNPANPSEFRAHMNEIYLDGVLLAIGGLIGVLLAWTSLRILNDRPSWFVRVTGVLASVWLVIVPIGTAIGIAMFQWRKPLSAPRYSV